MAYDQTLADTQRELEAARQTIATLTDRLAAAERDAARWKVLRPCLSWNVCNEGTEDEYHEIDMVAEHLPDINGDFASLEDVVDALSAAGEKGEA